MYTFPFTQESVMQEIAGKPMMLSYYEGVGQLSNPRELLLRKDSGYLATWGDNCWDVDGGALVIMNSRGKPKCRFNSVTIDKDVVYLSGDNCESHDGRMKAVLYLRKELGDDFQVVVSSHVDYEDTSVPRIVRSLKRQGVKPDQVTIVVGGVRDGEFDMADKDGSREIRVAGNLMGMTGLIPIMDGTLDLTKRYVLLLHDTCEATTGFMDAISKFDVGLPYDLIFTRNKEMREVGLWSGEFLSRLALIRGMSLINRDPYLLFKEITTHADMLRAYGAWQAGQQKDVYGNGFIRRVTECREWRLKKYVGSLMNGGRP
jgi:hypothetical protein